MDYDIEKTDAFEAHTARAVVALLPRETGEDDITEQERSWSAKKGETFTWRPSTLAINWIWDMVTGDWRTTQVRLFGFRLRKDGSVGLRSEQRDFLVYGQRGTEKTWSVKTPAYARELEERFRPQSYVGAME